MSGQASSSAMEDNLKRLTSEALRLCREKDVKADPFIIAYMACLQEARKAIDAASPGASLMSEMDPAQIASIAQLLVKLLADKDSPILEAARMQVMMEIVFKQQRELVDHEALEQAERLGMLARAVTEPRPSDRAPDGHERLFARVLEYVAVASGMELAVSDNMAKEEVRVAVESVFPLSTLVRFTTLDTTERVAQVSSLTCITLGICIYNQSLGRGGIALPPGTASCLPQASRLLRDINRHVATLSADVASYAGLMRVYAPMAVSQSGAEGDLLVKRERAQAESIHKAQTLVLWEGLREDLSSGLEVVNTLETDLQETLLLVHGLVGSSSAVAKESVLPQFERLGNIHQTLRDELRLLVVRQRLADELTGFMDGYVTILQKMTKSRRVTQRSPVDEEALAHAARAKEWRTAAPALLADGVEWLSPSDSTSDVKAESIEEASIPPAPGIAFHGFDAVLLAQQGMLARCLPRLGLLSFKGDTYGFASPESMTSFAADPTAANAKVHAVLTRQPVLAKLLGRTAAFPCLDLTLVVNIMSGPLKVDFGCQTPVHFVDKFIDYTYEWNVWALRRRALALANLRQKCTHGTQTGLSHFKRDVESQVWQPKAAQVQTRVNKGQAMPKKLQYVAGLRGAPATKMHVVRLELDLGQPHQ